MSSLAGKTPTAGSSLYNATKFGLRGFAGAMRAELHGTGVGVSAIFPGFIRDAGMFHVTGVKLPFGVGTKSPAPRRAGDAQGDRAQQGRARRRAGRPAPGRRPRPLVPDIAAAVSRRSGGDEIAKAHEDAHMANRRSAPAAPGPREAAEGSWTVRPRAMACVSRLRPRLSSRGRTPRKTVGVLARLRARVIARRRPVSACIARRWHASFASIALLALAATARCPRRRRRPARSAHVVRRVRGQRT